MEQSRVSFASQQTHHLLFRHLYQVTFWQNKSAISPHLPVVYRLTLPQPYQNTVLLYWLSQSNIYIFGCYHQKHTVKDFMFLSATTEYTIYILHMQLLEMKCLHNMLQMSFLLITFILYVINDSIVYFNFLLLKLQ